MAKATGKVTIEPSNPNNGETFNITGSGFKPGTIEVTIQDGDGMESFITSVNENGDFYVPEAYLVKNEGDHAVTTNKSRSVARFTAQ